MDFKKIAIVGISGSGKSTFSRRLAEKTGLPLFHMDTLFWKGNWEAVPEEKYLKSHEELIRKDEWIIEGYIDEKMAKRLSNADLIVYLDYSGARCVWRLLMRWFKHRKVSRPELPREAVEEFMPKFFWLVFTRGERSNIEQAIVIGKPIRVERFCSPRELEQFIKKL